MHRHIVVWNHWVFGHQVEQGIRYRSFVAMRELIVSHMLVRDHSKLKAHPTRHNIESGKTIWMAKIQITNFPLHASMRAKVLPCMSIFVVTNVANCLMVECNHTRVPHDLHSLMTSSKTNYNNHQMVEGCVIISMYSLSKSYGRSRMVWCWYPLIVYLSTRTSIYKTFRSSHCIPYVRITRELMLLMSSTDMWCHSNSRKLILPLSQHEHVNYRTPFNSIHVAPSANTTPQTNTAAQGTTWLGDAIN